MGIPSRKRDMKGYSPWLLKRMVSSMVIAFLIVSIGNIGVISFFLPVAEAQNTQRAVQHTHDALIRAASEVQNRHIGTLMSIPGVVGTGVGIGPDGLPIIRVFTTRAGVPGIPDWLESIPVEVEVTGMVIAFGDTTARYRPAPIGVSTGHPAITAGTIGARVKDGMGNVYALSNNHVYANQNDANIGDSALQPGPSDGGSNPADKIGELFDFEPIDFSLNGENYMDAAIALSSTELLGNSTLPDGYGRPNSAIFGDSDGDGFFDNKDDLLQLPVQKYGRSSSLTHGQVSAINVFVEVCYEQFLSLCLKSAYFNDQIQISPAGFSSPGDSGSLIVTDDENKNPVGLLFAGSDTTTFANPIDLVLNRFGVTIDDEGGPAPIPPVAPSDPTAAAVSSSQINLAWTDNSDNEDGFKIERCTGAGCTAFSQIATVGGNVTTYSNTGLAGSTTYTYRIRAYNAGGNSDYSNLASATTDVGASDFNGDGNTDLLWRHKTTGGIYVWYLNGISIISGVSLVDTSDTNWEIVGASDFNGDGNTDLLWRHKTTGGIYVWYLNGISIVSGASIVGSSDTDWEIVGASDFNGDGNTDLLWRHKTTGGIYVWYLNGISIIRGASMVGSSDINWAIVAP
jgi:hypothetical protein